MKENFYFALFYMSLKIAFTCIMIPAVASKQCHNCRACIWKIIINLCCKYVKKQRC